MTRLASYFARLREIGSQTEATNRDGQYVDIDDAISSAVDMALQVKSCGGRIMFVGNGGSAGIASHMSTDWLKNGGFSALCFNDPAQLTCLGNDLGYERVFALPIEQHGREGDLLVAISSSGKSPNILAAVTAARKIKAGVITLSGFRSDNPLRKLGDINFWLPDQHYGFVEIGHLAICHAMLDIAIDWQQAVQRQVTSAATS
jgi:D-sedoheptulose 7-phosphate isomerase